jgi:cysteine protease ATG4
MAENDFTRVGKKIISMFWDPLPRNDDPSEMWCLGKRYDSRYHEHRHAKVNGSSPSAHSESETSQADSAVVTVDQKPEETAENGKDDMANSKMDLLRSDEENTGWPPEFLDDLEARLWLTYRDNFPPIAKSTDPAASSAMSFTTKLRNLGNQGGFTSDAGWGCMIRSGQSLLANSLAMVKLGRDWRVGQNEQKHKELLSLFADTPEAPFSIHKFVEHGAQACGKYPGQWFGPSATARSLQ